MVVVPCIMGSGFRVWGFAFGFDPTNRVQGSDAQVVNPEP